MDSTFYWIFAILFVISPIAIWVNVYHMRDEIFNSQKKIVRLLERIANDLEGKPNEEVKDDEDEHYAALRKNTPKQNAARYSKKWMS